MAISFEIKQIVANALREDIGAGDVTSVPIIPASTLLKGIFLAKADGIVAGLDIAAEVFAQVDPAIVLVPIINDGVPVSDGEMIATIEGDGPGILIGERVALNFMQRMSGIATMTRNYQSAAVGTNTRVLDTRKTVPGLRLLDKLAVKLGGGTNHRMGLYDMVLIKDNHIKAAGGITAAVAKVREANQHLPIEIEVENLDQLNEALALNVDRIMLDNMTSETMRRAVGLAAGRVELEASGGITLERIPEVAATGVDYVSVGALTHSVVALDISLDITISQRERENPS